MKTKCSAPGQAGENRLIPYEIKMVCQVVSRSRKSVMLNER